MHSKSLHLRERHLLNIYLTSAGNVIDVLDEQTLYKIRLPSSSSNM